MIPDKKVVLHKGKEKPIKNKHHWIFSGAIQSLPAYEPGEIMFVVGHDQEPLGSAYFNPNTSITGRMISFDKTPPMEAVKKNIIQAIQMRSHFLDERKTNAYRLINSEGDMIPGLIVDKYKDVLVLQISTMGMDKMKSFITETLAELLSPVCIYEKSLLPSRREEGLQDAEGVLYGELPQEIQIIENELRFTIDILHGQKTGFFLDQREMRKLVQSYAEGKRVLNCFSYTGGFAVYAKQGGATSVDSVDISPEAITLCRQNMELNGFDGPENRFLVDDVFEFLRKNPIDQDFVILDPPAFVKTKKDVIQGCRGYKDINRLALSKMPKESLLLTSSCSHYVDETLFQTVVFQAAVEAKRNVRIIQKHHLAVDHPINIFHPETAYLKSLLLYVE
jgi:23S rRNA (cytosine1962-C5)-methyltransferase